MGVQVSDSGQRQPGEVRICEDLIRPNRKQRRFLDALFESIKFILYGGAAGGGKSFILRWGAVYFLVKAFALFGVRDVVVGLFCEDYPSLEKRHLAKIETEFPKWLGELKKDFKLGLHYRLRPEFGGGIIILANLDEASKYDSVEFAAVFVDELTKNKLIEGDDKNIFDQLRKRLRWPRKAHRWYDSEAGEWSVTIEPHFPCGKTLKDDHGNHVDCDLPGHEVEFVHPFAAGTNPGGKGHAFVKRMWVDGDLPDYLQSLKGQFLFIQALSTDNPHNPDSYYRDLRSLPPLMAKAYADGDWDLFVGQFFSEWRRERHVIKSMHLPQFVKRVRALDWGFHPGYLSVGWYGILPNKRVIKYRELYRQGMTPEQAAKEIIRLSEGEDIAYTVIDPACKNAQSDGGVSIQEQLGKAGLMTVLGSNARVAGWTLMHEYLRWQVLDSKGNVVGEQEPMLQFTENCKNAIRTIPTLVFAEAGDPEDLDTDGEDHPADETRYFLMSRPPLTKVPLGAMTDEMAEAVLRANQAEQKRRAHR